MAIFLLTVDDPGAETRAIESHWVQQACRLAVQDFRSTSGTKTSGEITGDFGRVLGRWEYTPVAAK